MATKADTFLKGTGRWFDGQMEVLSNTYRRNVRLILGVIGIFVALFFNVNALTIGQQLAENAALRQSAVVIADEVKARDFTDCKDEKKGEEQYTCAAKQIALFTDAGVLIPLQDGYEEALRDVWTKPGTSKYDYGLLVLGMAITAVAVSFGGPFWFDFLRFLTGARKQLN